MLLTRQQYEVRAGTGTSFGVLVFAVSFWYIQNLRSSPMKIVFDSQAGIYFAFCQVKGKPCLGFSESRTEAMNFCFELVLEADTSVQQKEQA